MRKRKWIPLILLLCFVLQAAGCGQIKQYVTTRFGRGATDSSGSGYNIYYIKQADTGIGAFAYQLTATTESGIIDECLQALAVPPDDANYREVLSGDVVVDHYTYEKDRRLLTLYFTDAYRNQSDSQELLARAAIVKTMTQFRGIIDYVSFGIGSGYLTDENGEVMKMKSADYVSAITNDLDRLEDANLTLYYITQDGTGLKKYETSQRYYNYNKDSMAAVLMDVLLRGPVTDEYLASMASDVQVRNIHISEGVCTVDFNQSFLKAPENVRFELSVYSVVNSLCTLPDVSQVKITVDGAEIRDAPSGLDLSVPLSPIMELVR